MNSSLSDVKRERRLNLAEAFLKLGLIFGLVAIFSLMASATFALYFCGLSVVQLLVALAFVYNAKD